jgi:UDPglucose--hexose-1-phosphate uridylyltransferase
MTGCSNAHPHGQVWSLSVVPSIPGRELASMQREQAASRLRAYPEVHYLDR